MTHLCVLSLALYYDTLPCTCTDTYLRVESPLSFFKKVSRASYLISDFEIQRSPSLYHRDRAHLHRRGRRRLRRLEFALRIRAILDFSLS